MRYRAIAAGVVLFLLPSCSGSDRLARVSGRILIGDEPLTAGRVLLKAPPGSHVTSTKAYINEDGTFSMAEAPVGPLQIAVDTEAVGLAADLLPQFTFSGTAEQLRARVAEYEAGGVTELVYQPAGPDLAGELARMMDAVGSASS